MHLRIGEVIVWATALKLILEVSGSKVSRIKGFSLYSPHADSVFSFSDIHGAFFPFSDGICDPGVCSVGAFPLLKAGRLHPPTGGLLDLDSLIITGN